MQAAGGTNFAVGGARVSTQSGWPDPATATVVPTVTSQVQAYLAAQPRLDSRAIYTLWAGANDVLGYTNTNAAALLNPATSQAAAVLTVQQVVGEATNLTGLIKQLQQAGAGTVMVINLPDIGKTPAASAQTTALWTSASRNFNAMLNYGISTSGGNIVALNAFDLFSEIIANPKLYGFTNVTQTACTTTSSSTCTSATLVSPDANRTYLFADSVHPTGAGHALLAQYAASVLQAPGQIGMLAETPLAGSQSLLQVVDERLLAATAQTGAYAAYNKARQSMDGSNNNPGLDSRTDTLTVGINYAIDQNVLLGLALGMNNNKADFGNNSGGFKLDQTMVSAYGRYREGPWAVHALGMLGSLGFNDVTRRFALGAALRSEIGNTKGYQTLLRVGGQYDFALGSMTLSPLANLTWQQIDVKGYSEQGQDSSAMNYAGQNRKSLVSSLGIKLSKSGEIGEQKLNSFVSLAWEKELKVGSREVRANVSSMSGSFGLPVYQGQDDRLRLDLGTNLELPNNFSAYASYRGQFGGGDRVDSVQIGINKAF